MIRLFIYFWRTLNIILPLLPSRWPELLFIEGSLWWRKPGTFQNVLESSEIFYSCSWTYSANLWLREKRRIDVFRRLKKTSSKVRLAKSTIHNDSNESVRTWGGGWIMYHSQPKTTFLVDTEALTTVRLCTYCVILLICGWLMLRNGNQRHLVNRAYVNFLSWRPIAGQYYRCLLCLMLIWTL